MSDDDTYSSDSEQCDYCDTDELVYRLESDRGPVRRCLSCLAVEQGQQRLSLPFEAFWDRDLGPLYDSEEQLEKGRKMSYEMARDWWRILARIRMDEPILVRDPVVPSDQVREELRTFLTNVMGSDVYQRPSDLISTGGNESLANYDTGNEQ